MELPATRILTMFQAAEEKKNELAVWAGFSLVTRICLKFIHLLIKGKEKMSVKMNFSKWADSLCVS